MEEIPDHVHDNSISPRNPLLHSTLLPSLDRSTVVSDDALLAAFLQKEDQQAFTELMQRHGRLVFSTAKRLVDSVVDAEEIYQTAFLLLARKAGKLLERRSLAGWLYNVTRKLAADCRKLNRKRLERERIAGLTHALEASDPEHCSPMHIHAEQMRRLMREIDKLSPKLRELLVLAHLEGLSQMDISRRLGLPMGTVASRLNRARTILKNRLVCQGVPAAVVLAMFSGLAEARLSASHLPFPAALAALHRQSIQPFVSTAVFQLYQGAMHTMVKHIIRTLVLATVALFGIGWLGYGLLSARTNEPIISTSPPQDDAKSKAELKKLQGKWHCAAVVIDEKFAAELKGNERVFESMTMEFTGDLLAITLPDQPTITYRIELDLSGTPKKITCPDKPNMKAVYSISDDVLLFTSSPNGEGMPKSVAVTNDSNTMMLVLQRHPLKKAGKTPESKTSERSDANSLDRTFALDNMKQLAIALHNYHSDFLKLPTNIEDKKGKPLLSWRVELLPYLNQDALYRQFKKDEPWDSEHNQKLINRMPKEFTYMSIKEPKAGERVNDPVIYSTPFIRFNGLGAMMESKKKIGFKDVTDGLSNTIMLAEAKQVVIWTKPDDLEFDGKTKLPPLGGRFGPNFLAVMGDGVGVILQSGAEESELRKFITRNGNEVGDMEKIRMKQSPAR